MKMYHRSAKSSKSWDRTCLSGANLRYLAAELERLAQELHRGKTPTNAELVTSREYELGRTTGYEVGAGVSVYLSGFVHSLRRVAKHRRSAVRVSSEGDSDPSVYPLVSSALEGEDQS